MPQPLDGRSLLLTDAGPKRRSSASAGLGQCTVVSRVIQVRIMGMLWSFLGLMGRPALVPAVD